MERAILDDVHAFWFGPLAAPQALPFDRVPMWFGATPQVDEDIRGRFGGVIDEAAALADITGLTPKQQLGLIVLLDQMTRNTRRGSPLTYAHDVRAREVARVLVAGGLKRFTYIERMFAILPMGHSEAIADQDEALALFEAEILPYVAVGEGFWKQAWHQAQHHRDTVARFGRFPHRNAILGRQSTTEEEAFLAAERGS